jgi:hypothetical protein
LPPPRVLEEAEESQFFAFCVRRGWVTQESEASAVRCYLTDEGRRDLESQFGIKVVFEDESS